MAEAGYAAEADFLQPGQALRLLQETVGESRQAGQLEVVQILGRNPGPMTGPGTNSYLLGRQRCALIDPGPRDPAQLETFKALLNGRPLDYILVTHTHGDHSPAAADLAAATGAELIGLSAPEGGNQDHSFSPARQWQDGDHIEIDGHSLRFVHTPGHVSNHFCYFLSEQGLLFTGDHVLQGTTPVILPPDGDMTDYLRSLEKLLNLPLRYLAPGHGRLITEPQEEIRKLIAHRLRREEKILTCLRRLQQASLDELVVLAYDDVAEHLYPWAKKTMTAHLIKLQREERVLNSQDRWIYQAVD